MSNTKDIPSDPSASTQGGSGVGVPRFVRLVCGFPGVGKSHLCRKMGWHDSDSSQFSHRDGWPNNYIEHLKSLRGVALVSTHKEVRAALVDFQRSFATRDGGAVLDGRDIGTVICPNADAKLFVTASAACRADRRYKELSAKGHDVTPAGVLADVEERDKRDRERATAPMVAADDATLIDTSDMSIEQAVATAIAAVDAARHT